MLVDENKLLMDMERHIGMIDHIMYELQDVINSSYNLNSSHGYSHIINVTYRAINVNVVYNLQLDPKEVIVACLLHDMFSNSNREHHHTEAYEYVMGTEHLILEDIDKVRVAHAVLEHRASYQGVYYSKLSELVAMADREPPVIEDILNRSYNYTQELHPKLDPTSILEKVLSHLKDKYSRTGYIKYPELYIKVYQQQLEELYMTIDTIIDNPSIVVLTTRGIKIRK